MASIVVVLLVALNPRPQEGQVKPEVPLLAAAQPSSLPVIMAAGAPAMPPPVPPTAAQPSPPYLKHARLIAERESAPGADGISRRTRLLEIESKYPFVRVEETRRYDAARGESFTVWRVAMVADHILVRLHPDATEEMLETLNRQLGATIRRRLKRKNHYLVAFDAFGLETVPQRIKDYRASPMITEVAEPDYLVDMVDTVPDDPRYGELWGAAKMRCPEAWNIETGTASVVVGVIDSGTKTNHEDLAANIWINPWENPTNGVDDDANGYIDDVHGWDFANNDAGVYGPSHHGTHVAGTIAAVGNNSTGVVGVSWNSRLMILKMFSDSGSGQTSAAIDALEYARTMRERGVPIRVTNNSWGGGGYSTLLRSAIEDTGEAGMLFVAAAGNYPQFSWRDNDEIDFYPASYDLSNVISVAASTSTDGLASFSHYGATSVDLAAPGANILSTLPSGYGSLDGTSMATPQVAGACALIWEAYPAATWEQVRGYIMAGVTTNAAFAGRMVSNGRLDVLGSMYAIAPQIDHEPLENTTNAVTDYVVEANIAPPAFVVPGSVRLHWNTSGPSNSYTIAPMTLVTNQQEQAVVPITNALYRATIPAQPLEGQVYYYIEAQTTGGVQRTHPVTAPSIPHQFEVVASVSIWIAGDPGTIGGVSPPYGIHTMPYGVTVEAEADRFAEETEAHRYECVGWEALGSPPAEGSTNQVAFALEESTALIWQWQFQYSLQQSSLPTGVIESVTWWEAGLPGQTGAAPDPVMNGTVEERFVEWQIGGQRWPDATNMAVNPAAAIGMSTARHAVAIYLPEDEDSDDDDLPDWWERHFFGSLAPLSTDDLDGDGFSNDRESADGTNPRDAASHPIPPAISHTPLADPQGHPAPWQVTAVVTDNFSVASATLHWSKVPDGWNEVPMLSGTGDVYRATIPAPGVLDDHFIYWIEAEDDAGYTAQTAGHSFDVVYPVFSYTPTNIAMLVEADTLHHVVVTLSNDGNTGLTWLADAGWIDAVEMGPNGATHSGANDLWHVSTNRAYSGDHAWYCGSPSSRQYVNRINASLQLPPVLPVSGTFLTFKYWADIEYDAGLNDDHYWDGGVVEISTDGGSSFIQISPVGGYPHRITPNDESPFPYDTPCFGGDGDGWVETSFDLSAYADQIVHLRLRFGSDWAAVEEGWYIDDIAVAFPSPTSGWLGMLPNSGSLAPGGNSMATVRLDSAGMPTGLLPGMVQIRADNPVNPINSVGVALSVQDSSDLVLLGSTGSGISASGTVVVFEWAGFDDRSYTLYERTSLVDVTESWMAVEAASNIPGLTGTMTHTVNVENVDQRFYRLAVQ
ncbi:MAG: S8 family serine peptidase [Kiritimatiellia bacterium]|nr:S8 family serine peptidase [Kiritimatiellia bacterium]MDP7025154.1 S8 family serine peptidase [Kiritimatiellia bacterium]